MNIENFCIINLQILSQYKNAPDIYDIVETRLNQSFQAYNDQLEKGLRYLRRRDELKLLKKLNKMRK